MDSEPINWCEDCKRTRETTLHLHGRGDLIPPERAARWLQRTCPKTYKRGCPIRYRAGIKIPGFTTDYGPPTDTAPARPRKERR